MVERLPPPRAVMVERLGLVAGRVDAVTMGVGRMAHSREAEGQAPRIIILPQPQGVVAVNTLKLW